MEISSAILSSVYPPGVSYGVDGVLLPLHSETISKSIGATIDVSSCLSKYVNTVKSEHVEVLNNTALSAMLSVSSVRYALEVQLEIIIKTFYR